MMKVQGIHPVLFSFAEKIEGCSLCEDNRDKDL